MPEQCDTAEGCSDCMDTENVRVLKRYECTACFTAAVQAATARYYFQAFKQQAAAASQYQKQRD